MINHRFILKYIFKLTEFFVRFSSHAGEKSIMDPSSLSIHLFTRSFACCVSSTVSLTWGWFLSPRGPHVRTWMTAIFNFIQSTLSLPRNISLVPSRHWALQTFAELLDIFFLLGGTISVFFMGYGFECAFLHTRLSILLYC